MREYTAVYHFQYFSHDLSRQMRERHKETPIDSKRFVVPACLSAG